MKNERYEKIRNTKSFGLFQGLDACRVAQSDHLRDPGSCDFLDDTYATDRIYVLHGSA